MAAFFCRWGSKHSEIVLTRIHDGTRWVSLLRVCRGRAEHTDARPRFYLPLIAIRLTFCCAVGDFGRVTLRTPFLNDASILS